MSVIFDGSITFHKLVELGRGGWCHFRRVYTPDYPSEMPRVYENRRYRRSNVVPNQ